MKEIQLRGGLVALVDDEDFGLVRDGRWHVLASRTTLYARKHLKGGCDTRIMMHTLLTGWPLVDHVNGNGLDNRRVNIRPATSSQNSMNRRVRSDSRSGLKGVYRRKQRDGSWADRWAAHIQVEGRRVNLGNYPSPVDAALAYDAAAARHFGEFARLNFPAGCAA